MLIKEKEEVAAREYEKYFQCFDEETDRGCVLVAVGVLDDLLERLIRAQFSNDATTVKRAVDPLFKGTGPLSSFWAKVQISYSLDLITEWMYEDLERIRELRNMFAHEYKRADFNDPAVIKLTEKLMGANYAAKAFMEKEHLEKKDLNDKSLQQVEARIPKKERVRLAMTVSFIAGYLTYFASTPQYNLKRILRELNSLSKSHSE